MTTDPVAARTFLEWKVNFILAEQSFQPALPRRLVSLVGIAGTAGHPGTVVQIGQHIGENAKPDDLEVNPMKSKQLTNFRVSGKDDAIRLTPPKRMTLEQAIAYIDDDEIVEVTPKNIGRRKARLDPNERKKASRSKQAA